MRLLFDLDGTLTDPFDGITKCIQYALEKSGRQVPAAGELRWCIGPPLLDSLMKLLETDDVAKGEEALGLYRERFSEKGLYENEICDGIEAFLERLSSGGHTLSVATAKPTVYAKRIIEHFELSRYFCSVDGSELDGRNTNKSDLIAHVLLLCVVVQADDGPFRLQLCSPLYLCLIVAQ